MKLNIGLRSSKIGNQFPMPEGDDRSISKAEIKSKPDNKEQENRKTVIRKPFPLLECLVFCEST